MNRFVDFPRLDDVRVVCIDTETTGLSWYSDKIIGFSLAVDGGAGYWSVDDVAFSQLREWAKTADVVLVGHNLKFDLHFLRQAGVEFPVARFSDTMVRAALIDEHLPSYSLDYVSRRYLGEGKADEVYKDVAAKRGGEACREQQAAFLYLADSAVLADYAIKDVDLTLRLWLLQEKEIERQELRRVDVLESDLIPVLVDMEHRGVSVDLAAAHRAYDSMSASIGIKARELNSVAGFLVNTNSSRDMRRLFNPIECDDGWILSDGTKAGKTKAGAPSIDADCLRRMKHPAAALILQIRKMAKARDTFIQGYILDSSHSGVVHCNFNQTKSANGLGTATGRLSVNSPALQQIHKRDKDIAPLIRSLFIPDDRCQWICNDWAQMDFRVFAHYINEPSVIAAYRDNPRTDFHRLVADMTGLPRSPEYAGQANAKQINLGLLFGMGQGKLAQEMGLPFTVERVKGREYVRAGDEAVAVFDKYHSAVRGVKEMLKTASNIAENRGFVKTITGRRIRFPDAAKSYKAGGLVFQGTAADALKVKLVQLWRLLKELDNGARLMLNVHDEFDCSVPLGDTATMTKITQCVSDFSSTGEPIKLRVPVISEQGVGSNWWEASK